MRVSSQLFSTWLPVENEVSGLGLPQGPSWALFCCRLLPQGLKYGPYDAFLPTRNGYSLVNLLSDSTEVCLVPPLVALGTDGY